MFTENAKTTSFVSFLACEVPFECDVAPASGGLCVPEIYEPVHQIQSLAIASWQPSSLSLQVLNRAWRARLSPNYTLVETFPLTVLPHAPKPLRLGRREKWRDRVDPRERFSRRDECN